MGIYKMMMKEEPRLLATYLTWEAANPKQENENKCSGKTISVNRLTGMNDLMWKTVLRAC